MRKILISGLILLLASGLNSCNTAVANSTTDKTNSENSNDSDKTEVTKDINPTLETNDAVVEEVTKLEQEGKLKNVIIRKSLPVQITATGTEDILDNLILKAKGEEQTETKEVTKDINPTLETNDSVVEEVTKLEQEGKLKNVMIRESYPVQITATGPEDVLDSLILKAKGEDESK